MTSFWSRRRALTTGSLAAALVLAVTVLAGTAFGAAHMNSGVSGVATAVASPPPPTPASDQYGSSPGYKSKCAVKATATYKAALATAKTVLAAKAKKCTTKTCTWLAAQKYKAAIALALVKEKQSLKIC
jgi:hypothetical protein